MFEIKLHASRRTAIAGSLPRVQTGSAPLLRELASLGLTEEASIGILRVLLRVGARPAVIDPSES